MTTYDDLHLPTIDKKNHAETLMKRFIQDATYRLSSPLFSATVYFEGRH